MNNCRKRCEKEIHEDTAQWLETVYHCLLDYYGKQKPALLYKNLYQLVVMVVLSAQESDTKINKVAKELFKKFPDCESLAKANIRQIEEAIKQVGFYRKKARYLKELCTKILNEYEGKIPDTLEELVKLPGISRKGANAILAYGYSIPGVVIDRHAMRVLERIGVARHITKGDLAKKYELYVKSILAERYWIQFSLLLQVHGKTLCKPTKPRCNGCPINTCCAYYQQHKKISQTLTRDQKVLYETL